MPTITEPVYDPENPDVILGYNTIEVPNTESNKIIYDPENPDVVLGTVNTPTSTLQPFIAPSSEGSSIGLQGQIDRTQASAKASSLTGYSTNGDWRVRLSLASDSNYLYNADNAQGILAPLKATNGVVFPYTPQIQTTYTANYDATNLIHSNYKVFQYTNSGVDQITITSIFTAQDTTEANYLLAVMHFLKSITKMFYGQDSNPKNGSPPPLCFLSGYGTYQFDKHPLVLNSFTCSLPDDVDYIKATINDSSTGKSAGNTSLSRLPSYIRPGGLPAQANFTNQQGINNSSITYVPTKIQISISAYPVVSRNAVSNKFSLRDYATGKLIRGSINNGGFW